MPRWPDKVTNEATQPVSICYLRVVNSLLMPGAGGGTVTVFISATKPTANTSHTKFVSSMHLVEGGVVVNLLPHQNRTYDSVFVPDSNLNFYIPGLKFDPKEDTLNVA